MSVKPEVRKAIGEYLKDRELEGYFLDDQAYDDSIVGVDESTGRIIYDYDKMVEELASEYFFSQNAEEEFQSYDDCRQDAIEWIDYNTMRALPYFGDKAPIIIHSVSEITEMYGENND